MSFVCRMVSDAVWAAAGGERQQRDDEGGSESIELAHAENPSMSRLWTATVVCDSGY